ncbi:hypothetical protein AKJ16_DCAP05977 [Drosera capensis]
MAESPTNTDTASCDTEAYSVFECWFGYIPQRSHHHHKHTRSRSGQRSATSGQNVHLSPTFAPNRKPQDPTPPQIRCRWSPPSRSHPVDFVEKETGESRGSVGSVSTSAVVECVIASYCMKRIQCEGTKTWACEECKLGNLTPYPKPGPSLVPGEHHDIRWPRPKIKQPPINAKVKYLSPEEVIGLGSVSNRNDSDSKPISVSSSARSMGCISKRCPETPPSCR